jgi:hypothetical protein
MGITMYKKAVLIFVIANFGCGSPVEDRLVGEWQLDSARYFYNNFENSSGGWHHKEIYEFTPTGVAITRAVNSSISSQYLVKGNELIYLDDQGNPSDTHKILALTENNLVMKTEKQPLFKGPNQRRYEIRYFSKVFISKLIENE